VNAARKHHVSHIGQEWKRREPQLVAVVRAAGLSVGDVPEHDCYLYWDGSSTPVIYTKRFDDLVRCASQLESILNEMTTMWRLFVYEEPRAGISIARRYLISSVGSQPLPDVSTH